MADRRQVLRALLLGAAGLAVPAGCGVPTGGGPIVDGPGPSADPVSTAKGRPPEPGDAISPSNLVELFLYAISGPLDTSEALDAARERARKFLSPSVADKWKPSDEVLAYRIEGLTSSASGANSIITATLTPVGVFLPELGLVDPTTGFGPAAQMKFTVSPAEDGSGMRISVLPPELPPVLPLATDALDNKYFTPQLIYFWDTRQRWLVPDLRYVPNTGLADSGRLTAIVRWLLLNPSELVKSVSPPFFPAGTNLLGPNVVIQGDRVVVPFSAALQRGPDLAKVLAQLQWSLQPLHKLTSPVELWIGGQRQQVDGGADAYRTANPADTATSRTSDAQLFCVAGGRVVAVDGALPVVVAEPDYNRDVQMAALARDKRQVALVTTQRRLLLGSVDDRGSVSYLRVDRTGQTWRRPAWLPSGRRLLVLVDGELLAVAPSGVVSEPLATDVTAFAVAPDGYRIALVQSGQVKVLALRGDGDQPALSGTPRLLDPGLPNPTGVAWSRLDRLVVAGLTGTNQGRLAEVAIDNAIRVAWSTNFALPIESVVAYPRLPSDPPGPGQVMVQTKDGAVFRVSTTTSQLLTAKDLPNPAPSASGGGTPPTPTAPFYPD